jgi:hypothetical protein
MAGPWDKYAATPAAPAAAGPWQKYANATAAQPPPAPATRKRVIGGRGGVTPVTVEEPIVKHPDSGLERIGQGADDLMRSIANGGTLGAADKLAAYMGSDGDYTKKLAEERQKSADAAARDPGQDLVGKGVGTALGVSALAGNGVTLTPFMEGAPLTARVALGATEGAGYGAANELGHDDGPNGMPKVWAALHGAQEGAKFGALLPAAGSLASKAYETIAPYFSKTGDLSRRATGILSNAAAADAQGLRGLSGLGPDAMAADAGPSMTGLAQGVATTPGAGRSAVVDALARRTAGRNARLGEDLTKQLGPYQDPELLKQSISDARQAVTGPQYRAAISNAPRTPARSPGAAFSGVDVEPAISALTDDAAGLARGQRGTMDSVVADLRDVAAARSPEIAAQRLLNVRKQLDAQIVYDPRELAGLSSADKASQSALRAARAHVDDLVKGIPGIPAADATSAEYARLGQHVDAGFDVLDKGKSAVSPQALQAGIDALTPEARSAMQAGTRARLENAVGTQGNDLAALRSTIGEPQDWNNVKIGQVFSPDQAKGVTDAIKREQTFAQTETDVAKGSQTAQRTAAGKQLADRTDFRIPPVMEWPTAAAGAAGRAVLKALVGRSGDAVRQEVAQALTSTGEARDRVVQALLSAGDRRGAVARNLRDLVSSPAVIRALALHRSASDR